MKQNGVSLTDLKEGETGIVVSLDGAPVRCRRRGRFLHGRGRALGFLHGQGRAPHERGRIGRGCAQRLMDLGLTPGAKLTVVKSAPFGGPVEILVRGCRIALGRAMASRIIVEVM